MSTYVNVNKQWIYYTAIDNIKSIDRNVSYIIKHSVKVTFNGRNWILIMKHCKTIEWFQVLRWNSALLHEVGKVWTEKIQEGTVPRTWRRADSGKSTLQVSYILCLSRCSVAMYVFVVNKCTNNDLILFFFQNRSNRSFPRCRKNVWPSYYWLQRTRPEHAGFRIHPSNHQQRPSDERRQSLPTPTQATKEFTHPYRS